MTKKEEAKLRQAARAAAKAEKHVVVDIVPGDKAPELTGEAGHYTTPGGKPIAYPNAYAAKGRAVYHRSTRKVIVGAHWRPPVVWMLADGVWHTVGGCQISQDCFWVNMAATDVYMQQMYDDPPVGKRCDHCVIDVVVRSLKAL